MAIERKESIKFARARKSHELDDTPSPNLYRDIFPYDKICRIPFGNEMIPLVPAGRFRISDTTFRDGQQARPPYTVDQIGRIFDFLHRLAGPNGLITHSEFFLYTEGPRGG